ncbi:hypothetical protein ABGB19_02075 [Mycobacterium sp. B14F4]|uniref:hypothetical protein n=1 Tax=Mycobacterium sp. B14F4 TaxID=3153565 RepID=UPI00325F7729
MPYARTIVESYTTDVTLRQLFYRLVSLPHGHPAKIPNTDNAYSLLSRTSAEWRRVGTFPDLADQGAQVFPASGSVSPGQAIESLRRWYRRDRTEGQEYQVWLGVEKVGMVNQLRSWFRSDRGLPILALGGQATQGLIDELRRDVEADGRPAILLYAGDHDPSGWRILQSFVDRTGWWANPELPDWNPADMPENRGWVLDHHGKPKAPVPNYDRYRKYRVALQPEQCVEYGLPRNSAKEKDSNLPAFLANYAHTLDDVEAENGCGVQIEMDALEPNDLRQLFTDAVEQFWDDEAYDAVIEDEDDDREHIDLLTQIAERYTADELRGLLA